MVEKKLEVKSSKLKVQKTKIINLPLTKKVVATRNRDVLGLKAGDVVSINGLIVTCRDKMHKFLADEKPSKKNIPFDLDGTILYHCGPIVIPSHPASAGKRMGDVLIMAAGPTTSMRFEMYEPRIISGYRIMGVMGKGGMGERTLKAMREKGCVYLHTIGGAAVYLADRIKKVVDVWKLEEFGPAEAMWLLEVENFPAIVTMDAHGKSLHRDIEKKSHIAFKKLVGK